MKRAKCANYACKAHRTEEAAKLTGFDIVEMITLKENETGDEHLLIPGDTRFKWSMLDDELNYRLF